MTQGMNERTMEGDSLRNDSMKIYMNKQEINKQNNEIYKSEFKWLLQ